MRKSLMTVIIGIALVAGWFSNDIAEYLATESGQGKTKGTVTKERTIKYWRAPMDPNYTRNEPGKSPMGMDLIPVYEEENTATKERAIKYWRAPMDPNYTRNEPGKSPMGMDLIPVYEDEGTAPGTVRIDPGMVQSIGVRTAKAEKRDIFREIVTVGVVEADEQKIHKISPKFSGWIEKMFVDSTGAIVKADDMLLSIYSPELVSTEEEYLIALGFKKEMKGSTYSSIVKSSSKLAKSARERLKNFDVPEHQIKEIEQKGKIYKNLHIHSPNAGVVTKLNVRKGSHVTPSTVLYEITDLSTVWMNADVYEYEISWIKTGDKVQISFTAIPGKVYEGFVTYIYPYLDKDSRTMKVRVEVDNRNLELKPEMFANVKFLATPRKGTITIPTEAILYSSDKKIVLIADGEGRFHPVEIITGVEAGGFTEVLSGLKAGEEVVTSSQFLIDSESKLSEVLGEVKKGAVDKGQASGNEQTKQPHKMNHDMGHEAEPKMNHSKHDMKQDMEDAMDHSGHEMNHSQMNH